MTLTCPAGGGVGVHVVEKADAIVKEIGGVRWFTCPECGDKITTLPGEKETMDLRL